jgi:hypothetical protein
MHKSNRLFLVVLGTIIAIVVIWLLDKNWTIFHNSTLVPLIILLILLAFITFLVLLLFRENYNYGLEFVSWILFILTMLCGVSVFWLIWLKIHFSVLFMVLYVFGSIGYIAGMVKYITWRNSMDMIEYQIDVDKYKREAKVIGAEFKKTNLTNYRIQAEDIKSTDLRVLDSIKQFRPSWRRKHGRRHLEGGEVGNNGRLARFLRNKGFKVETEEKLSGQSRTDLLVNEEIAIECKKTLLSKDILDNLVDELQRIKELGHYKVHAVIYGHAKKELLDKLVVEIGKENITVLGNVFELVDVMDDND